MCLSSYSSPYPLHPCLVLNVFADLSRLCALVVDAHGTLFWVTTYYRVTIPRQKRSRNGPVLHHFRRQTQLQDHRGEAQARVRWHIR